MKLHARVATVNSCICASGVVPDRMAAWISHIQQTYGVDPYVFVGLYLSMHLGCFYWALYKVVRHARARSWDAVSAWGLLMAFSFLAPYLYVLVAGRNLPGWFNWVLGGLIVFSVGTMGMKVKRAMQASGSGDVPVAVDS